MKLRLHVLVLFCFFRFRSWGQPIVEQDSGFHEGSSELGWIHLEDGSSFQGRFLGAQVSAQGELVFTTAMVGYVESLTDPSFYGQIVVFTYPMIGNYGVPENDTRVPFDLIATLFESSRIQAAGVVICDCTAARPGHHLAVVSFSQWLSQNNVPGLCGIDTRALATHLRSHGVMRGYLAVRQDVEPSFIDINARNLVALVSSNAPTIHGSGDVRILVIDCGVKAAIVRKLVGYGAQVIVIPWDHDPASFDLPEYHGILVSNGPGDPNTVKIVIKHLNLAMGQQRPIFCICLGHQLLALAAGARITKLRYGNRGHNQPVKDLLSGRLYMTAQNHGYAVDVSKLPSGWLPYFTNLNDDTNEGIFHESLPFSSVQFHPEATGGPDDTGFLLERFVQQATQFMRTGTADSVRVAFKAGDMGTMGSEAENMWLPLPVKSGSKILLLGSGATRIGQAGEFDYAGTQAIKALKEANVTILLVNPNVASVQTQLGVADRTYLLPITPEFVEAVIARERPSGILLAFGGQTALNCGLELEERGVLARYRVRVLGTPVGVIRTTEDRDLFKRALQEVGQPVAESIAVTSVGDAIVAARQVGYPIILRSAFALGGLGSGFASNESELRSLAASALASSPQILIEQSLKGWKEVEYEVVRDMAGNTMTVCNMENLDPVGIHTGESIVVAPSQTLSNEEYFMLRDSAVKIIQHLGVIGECNIQFGLHPKSLKYVVIEVNPRLSRSSALASKATGYPLAYIAAKLSLGLRLDQLRNAVTQRTSAFFEPALDYLAVKVPRWDFDKFPKVQPILGSAMKSIGESMAIGRSLCEALQKGLRMAGRGVAGLEPPMPLLNESALLEELGHPTDRFIPALVQAFVQRNLSLVEIRDMTHWDLWILRRLESCVLRAEELRKYTLGALTKDMLLLAKQDGFSDLQIASRLGAGVVAADVRQLRLLMGVLPVVKQIDTMAAEFPAFTNYLYMSYLGSTHDVQYLATKPGLSEGCRKDSACGPVMVVGSGTYHVGSSVEFDSSAVSCARTLRALGRATIMVNYNPETVSTDFDESDRLYFEEISFERLMDIIDLEHPQGLILSMGGQVSNNLVMPLHRAGVPVLGTHPIMVDSAEDRSKHSALLDQISVAQPKWQRFSDLAEARHFAYSVGYPVLVRPSYVLSGAAMAVVNEELHLDHYLSVATKVSPEYPVVISKFWEDSQELDVDVVASRGNLVLYAVSEHVEEAGVHSGDGTLIFPSEKVAPELQMKLKEIVASIASALNITGAFNIQALHKDGRLAVIETNLRASRSLPFVSKILGVDFAAVATLAIMNHPVVFNPACDLPAREFGRVGVKAAQFSFLRLPEADPLLGVEMRSTGEVAALDNHRAGAFLKAIMATGLKIPPVGCLVYMSLPAAAPQRLAHIIDVASESRWNLACSSRDLSAFPHALRLDFEGMSSTAVAQSLQANRVCMVFELGRQESHYPLRRAAIDYDIPVITNANLFLMLVDALHDVRWDLASGTANDGDFLSLQEYFTQDRLHHMEL